MMTNQQAKRGKSKQCPNGCGTVIFFESRFGEDGQLITKDNSPDSKWWMMEDVSKALHSCPNKGKNFSPKPPTQTVPEIDLTNFKPELVSMVEQKIWKDIVGKVAEYYILTQIHLKEYPEITIPQVKGLISKESYEVLNQINERKAKHA